MRVAFYGHGSVAARCLEILDELEVKVVESAEADLWISVHWPKVFRGGFPREGILNLHNSYLPWNRGAHPCTWAIVDGTPHGVTFHWVDQGIDTGPIFYREALEIRPDDTADSLYKRTAELELDVFRSAVKLLQNGHRHRIAQEPGGSFHRKADFQRLERALTTSDCGVVHA